MKKTNDILEDININPSYGQVETRYGALKVPEVNEQIEKEQIKLKPILKFDDWGNEIEKSDEHGN